MNPARRTTAAAATAVVLATAGGLLTATAAPASAATTCTSPVFKRQFFANTTFSGTPKKTDCDSAIDQNWGTGAPASGLPTNYFGVRWSVTRDFGSGGPFTLSASGLDGIRVYLDGTRKIDLWKNTSTTVSKTVNLTIPSGTHTLRVDYVNWTGSAKVKFGYVPRTSATVDTVKPLAPTGASVSYDTATGKATIRWAKNKEMDLAGYRVFRRLKGASFGSTPLTTTTATSYTDTALPVTGDTYYYEVRAYDKAGNVSSGTADLAVTTVDRSAPALPTGLSTASEAEGLRVGWSAVEGAASYQVYRAASADGAYNRLGTTSGLSYLDASAVEDTTYYYRVTALDAAGNESPWSAAVTGKRRDLTPPSAVTGVTVTPTEYGFEVRWDANPTADLASYAVRRGELWGDEEEQVCSLYPGFHVSADTTSYAYTTLPDGEESCFIVDAIDDAGNSSFQWTGEAQIVTATEFDTTPSVATPEGSPLTLTATGAEGDEGNLLEWHGLGESAPEQAGGFRIYRWNPATSAYEKIAAPASGAVQYFDTGARRGTTSYYWVTAVADDGTESLPAGDWAVTAPAG
ncbi:cellulose 1,4-beta-cellobiosidase [Streptomyces sp. ISL-22]|uniref:fibronectin type III domain-containing protein n=1 Tax=unclassified Streptomyces TaxID=2593676 RepID=UPI001BEC245C|nr:MULTISPECIES: PA14 domain-containing protein [unclassified Streptomyces]MBT2416928.1 cellulose 1,4-beta-cellobiosidase [Streptomyces sp. ISL-24]MBT2436932.1 cellulose 1,4-beta-cellobiosidase [Streptomyces sp. ISL-22]